MPACPHCAADIASLEGFVPQAKLEERLKAKDGEIKALRESVTGLQGAAKEHGELKAERDRLAAELGSFKTRTERTEALRSAKLKPELLPSMEAIYASEISGLEEDKRPAFSDWLSGPAREHVLLAPHFAAPAATGAPPQQQRTAPPPSAGGEPPAGASRLSPAQVQQYFNSPEYKALPTEARAAKRAELAKQYTGG